MTYNRLIKIVMIGLFSTSHLSAQTAGEDRLRSVTLLTLSLEWNRYGDSPDRNFIVYLALGYKEDENREEESEGIFSSRYMLLYQGGGILLLFLLIRRLMGRGRKPDIRDKEI